MKILPITALFLGTFFGTWLIPTPAKPIPEIPATPSLSDRRQSPRLSTQRNASAELTAIARLQNPEERLNHLIALASSIPVDQLKYWLTPANLAPLDDSLRSLFLTITCDRWLESDPEALILWNAFAELVDTHHYLARWLIKDQEAATSYILTKPTGFHPADSMSHAIQILVKSEFNLAFDLTKNHLTNDEVLNPALLALAAQDLQTFITLSTTLPDQVQQKISPTIVASLLQSDFQGALSHLANQEDAPAKLIAARDILGVQPFSEALFDNLDKLPDGWLQKVLDESYLTGSTKSLPWLELGSDQLGITPKAFGSMLIYQQSTKFGPQNRPRILTILNNPVIPFKARSMFIYGQWGQIPYDQFTSELDQINDPALKANFLKSRAPFE